MRRLPAHWTSTPAIFEWVRSTRGNAAVSGGNLAWVTTRWALAHHWDSNRSHMKNKSHDIIKGELSAESQERRLRNYDPAKQPCKQGNNRTSPINRTRNLHACLLVVLFVVPGTACCALYSIIDRYQCPAGQTMPLKWWFLHTDLVSWTPTHTCVRILDTNQQGAKVPQTYMQRYNVCKWESYDLSVELLLRSLSRAALSLKSRWKMASPGSPPTIPHDLQVEQKQGQATMIWAIGAWVHLFYLKMYLKM